MNNLEPIKNIIFDLGGVILNIDYHLTVEAFEKLGVPNFETIFSQFNQSNLSDEFEIGKITEEEFYKSLVELSGIDFSFLQFKRAWNAMLLDLPNSRIQLLKKLSKKYRLFLFSNTNETHYNSFIIRAGDDFDVIFEKTYYSHQFGRRKPDGDSFSALLKENDLQPEETLFVDDSIQHIESARKIGIRTFHLMDTDILNEFE